MNSWTRIYLSVVVIISVGLAMPSRAATLYAFKGGTDGNQPGSSGVVFGKGGALYGTTFKGGSSDLGVVFSLAPPAVQGGVWTETILHSFTGPDGANPSAGLAVGSKGVLYGTTGEGGLTSPSFPRGNGTIFSLTPSPDGTWTFATIYEFLGQPDGIGPSALSIGPGGELYGGTAGGGNYYGSPGGWGTVFKLSPPQNVGDPWVETILYNFDGGSDGEEQPHNPIVFGPSGQLYGVSTDTIYETPYIFQLVPPAQPGGSWAFSVISSFVANSGDTEPGPVTLTPAGNLIGTVGTGPNSGLMQGFVYALLPPAQPGGAWTQQVLFYFPKTPGPAQPLAGVVIGKTGVLYGTTSSGGVYGIGSVFQATPPAAPGGAWTLTVLHSFHLYDDGIGPPSNVIIGPDGYLYGTSQGLIFATTSLGTVFAVKE